MFLQVPQACCVVSCVTVVWHFILIKRKEGNILTLRFLQVPKACRIVFHVFLVLGLMQRKEATNTSVYIFFQVNPAAFCIVYHFDICFDAEKEAADVLVLVFLQLHQACCVIRCVT